jgi:ubiquinone/menaquinone biosynthesis C-methylase UbiE
MKNQNETGMAEKSAYDARFSEVLGGAEYDDLLIALEWYNQFEAETGIALREYIAGHCEGFSEIRVLEAGPGTGITTLELVKADSRVKVVSVDNEPKMLEAVRDRFSKVAELKDRVEFVYSDILKFLESCPDESFDAFASVYTLHNFTPDFRRKVIGLIAQKLKKGGVFISGDKYAEIEELHQKDMANEIGYFDKFDAEAEKAEQAGDAIRAAHFRTIKQEWIEHYAEDEKNKITVDEQDEMFKELGFSDVGWMKRFDLEATVHAIKL